MAKVPEGHGGQDVQAEAQLDLVPRWLKGRFKIKITLGGAKESQD
jgi:hypothetical protein